MSPEIRRTPEGTKLATHEDERLPQQPLLIVVSGPSGAGKDTIVRPLLAEPRFKKVVTCTDRPPRAGEIHGEDYYFITREQFSACVQAGDFAEHVVTGLSRKGTLKSELQGILTGMKHVIWRIDMTRASTVRTFISENLPPEISPQILERTLTICVGVSSLFTLWPRIKERQPDMTRAEFVERMRPDWEYWMRHGHTFDAVVFNDNPLPGQTKEDVVADGISRFKDIVAAKEKELITLHPTTEPA